jgi:hypothetical protein
MQAKSWVDALVVVREAAFDQVSRSTADDRSPLNDRTSSVVGSAATGSLRSAQDATPSTVTPMKTNHRPSKVKRPMFVSSTPGTGVDGNLP